MKRLLKSPWLSHGFWNTLDHALTRILDAATTLVILWLLPTEQFANLALSQAWVAPMLILFVAPETVLYREFGAWKALGKPELLLRIRALRRFAWGKAQFALVLAAIAAWLVPSAGGEDLPRSQVFFALVWAFAIAIGPQVAGADREYLRLALRLKELNLITLVQKLLLFGLTWIASYFFRSNLLALAAAAVLTLVVSALFARHAVESGFRGERPGPLSGAKAIEVLSQSLRGFSIWNHLVGVVNSWVQTMDLFFLGAFKFAAVDIGMYGAALKIANFSLAGPLAVANLFSVKLGRAGAPEDEDRKREFRQREFKQMLGMSVPLLALGALQALVFWWLSPYLLGWLSHGRWSELDLLRVRGWLSWILAGCALLGSTLLWSGWLYLRMDIRKVFSRVALPWGCVSFVIYGYFCWTFGIEGAAWANPVVAAALVPFLVAHTFRSGWRS